MTIRARPSYLTWLLLALLAALASLSLVACRRTAEAELLTPARTIENKGSDTMVNLALRWAEEYMKLHPDVRISVTGGGSGTGIAAMINVTVLGLGRAAGETAPILFTVAAFFLPRLPNSVFDQTMALPYHLFVISTQVPGMPLQIQYGTALVLLVFVLSMIFVATLIRSRFRAKREW